MKPPEDTRFHGYWYGSLTLDEKIAYHTKNLMVIRPHLELHDREMLNCYLLRKKELDESLRRSDC